MDYHIGTTDEIAEGGRKVVRCGEEEVGVFRVRGDLVAWLNRCPHRQGPVCQGRIYSRVVEPVADDGTVRLLAYDEDRPHLVCPWHGYEFDLATGRSGGGGRLKLRRVELKVVGADVYVVL
jgi:nitrite reductase/ring-hydroxylating ferredoxin subunit